MLRKMKEDINRLRDILRTWIGRLNIITDSSPRTDLCTQHHPNQNPSKAVI
jgi:hypothetical protein